MPSGEVEISPDLIRRLLAAQQPDLAPLAVELMANGWDNVTYRVGDALVARLPRRGVAARLVANEQRWLPVLQPQLPLPVPAPARVGQPGLGYPWSWSILPFLPGRAADRNPPADMADAAVRLGRFLAALHTPAAPDAPANAVRGVPLADRHAAFTRNLSLLGSVSSCVVTAAWSTAMPCCGCGTPRSGRRPGMDPRCGCTATSTRPTSWSTTAASAA